MSKLHIEVKYRTLTSQDQCDRCGSRAQVLLITNSGELTFCGKHAAEHERVITERGYHTSSDMENE